MKNKILIIFLFTILGCQKNKNSLFLIEQSQYQRFKIVCGKDTTLVSKAGVKIKINANTFDCSNNEMVELEFAEILDKSDMILNRIYSINENGQYLESGGMFQIRNKSNVMDGFKSPIQLEIPTEIANSKMFKYSSKKIDDLLVWSESEEKIKLGNIESLNQGRNLFSINCSICHNPNLKDKMTGPALGNVQLFRDKDWLIRFTKNSQKMIADGDSISVCLFQEWNNSVMTSYESLSGEEIENIYKYIANESRLKRIKKNDITYLTGCEIFEQPELNFNINVSVQFENEYKYLLELFDDQWVNVDYLAFVDSKIPPIVLNMDKLYEDLNIVLAFQERNIVIPFVKSKSDNRKYSLWHPRQGDKIDFPLGEKVNIVAYSQSIDFQYKIMEYQPNQENNEIEFSMKIEDKTEFLNEIKKL